VRAHINYANVTATLALFIALGGGSYAALKVGSRQIANDSIRSVDVRNNQLKSVDVRNRTLLRRDFRPGQLDPGPQGPPGAQGPPGPPGQTLAFARVNANGTVDAARSKRITSANVIRQNPGGFGGIYCFSGLDFNAASVTATLEYPAPNFSIDAAIPAPSPGNCAPGTQAIVSTRNEVGSPGGGNVSDHAFYVAFN
jgi:hypothetical protein